MAPPNTLRFCETPRRKSPGNLLSAAVLQRTGILFIYCRTDERTLRCIDVSAGRGLAASGRRSPPPKLRFIDSRRVCEWLLEPSPSHLNIFPAGATAAAGAAASDCVGMRTRRAVARRPGARHPGLQQEAEQVNADNV